MWWTGKRGGPEKMTCMVILNIVIEIYPPRNSLALVTVSGLSVCQRLENGLIRDNTHLLQVGIITSRDSHSVNDCAKSRIVHAPAQTKGKRLHREGQYMPLLIIVRSHFTRTTCFARKLRMRCFASALDVVTAPR